SLAPPRLHHRRLRSRRVAGAGEEVADRAGKALGLLDEDEVPAIGEEHELGAADACGQLTGADRAADEVLLARDDQRGRGDARELGPKVEGREHLVVEEPESVSAGNLAV